jgi:hypothetical protein
MTREKPQDAFDLSRALLHCALQNIHQRALERRGEAIHDTLLLVGIVLSSSSLAICGCIVWWLIVEGRL